MFFGQENRQPRAVVQKQYEWLSEVVQRFENSRVAPHMSRNFADRRIPMFNNPITDMRKYDRFTSTQGTVTMTMSCHPLDPSVGAYGADPHSRRTNRHPIGHTQRLSRQGEKTGAVNVD